MRASLSSGPSHVLLPVGLALLETGVKHLSPVQRRVCLRGHRQTRFTTTDSEPHKGFFLPLSIEAGKLLPAIDNLTHSACRCSQDHLPPRGCTSLWDTYVQRDRRYAHLMDESSELSCLHVPRHNVLYFLHMFFFLERENVKSHRARKETIKRKVLLT